ncbi:GDSL-type esterase/lipase family protein [Diaminobutyricimonas aerilata]|uniref:GDSL-type esterase/lipase family protein n=1 Tax=Diaminobutyricimonas aerilata TaxID=1162967 RepID=UPI0012FE2861|nr:GDSL-type esterase/lipase family protein [Diaminobutyricimonas aerilata]
MAEVVETEGGLRPLRLTAEQHRRAPESLQLMAEFTSGVRLVLRTAASRLDLDVIIERYVMRHLGRPTRDAEFLAEAGGEVIARAVATPTGSRIERGRGEPYGREPGPVVRVTLDLGAASARRDVVVWFPHDAGVTLAGVSGDAPVEPVPDSARPHWVHHGSSISHGGNAHDPRETWPAQVGRALGIRWSNLGFGGNAMLDPMTARSIAAMDADVVTLELGINIVGADAMRPRALTSATHAFLDALRDRHPDAPIVLIGAFACPALETTPGPMVATPNGPRGTERGQDADVLTLQRSREVLRAVAAVRDDPALHYLDGLELFGTADAHLLEDGLHPSQCGLDLIARRFLEREVIGPVRADR